MNGIDFEPLENHVLMHLDLRAILRKHYPGAIIVRKSWIWSVLIAVFVAGFCAGVIVKRTWL